MKKLDPKSYTLNVAKDIQKALSIMRNFEIENSHIIESLKSDQLFYLRDKRHHEFVFYINAPEKKSKGNPTAFPLVLSPISADSKESFSAGVSIEGLVTRFNKWLNLLKEYNEVSFDEEDQFMKIYEDEVFADFEIIDEDAAAKPFDTNQQIVLYNFLESAILYLQQNYADNLKVQEIIEDANALKDEVTIVTKNVACRRFSTILAKIRKFNPVTYKDIHDVAKKEAIKYLLLESLEAVPKVIHYLGI